MARKIQPNIRWRKRDELEAKRIIRNFNAKIYRTAKNHPELKSALPERVKWRDFKKEVSTRNDYKTRIKQLSKFTERGQEKLVEVEGSNIKLTKWHKDIIDEEVAKINKRRQERKEMIESTKIKDNKEEIGYTRGDIGMGKQELKHLDPLNPFPKNMSKKERELKMKQIFREQDPNFWNKRDFITRDSYIKAIENTFGLTVESQHIINAINDMDIDDFMEAFRGDSGGLETPYAPNEENKKAHIDKLNELFNVPELTEEDEKRIKVQIAEILENRKKEEKKKKAKKKPRKKKEKKPRKKKATKKK